MPAKKIAVSGVDEKWEFDDNLRAIREKSEARYGVVVVDRNFAQK
jgi:hypothetical protein